MTIKKRDSRTFTDKRVDKLAEERERRREMAREAFNQVVEDMEQDESDDDCIGYPEGFTIIEGPPDVDVQEVARTLVRAGDSQGQKAREQCQAWFGDDAKEYIEDANETYSGIVVIGKETEDQVEFYVHFDYHM